MKSEQTPHNPDDFKRKTYTVTAHIKHLGWVEVETTTCWVANGLVAQVEAKVAAGDYRTCPKPPLGAIIVTLEGEDGRQ